MLNPDEFLENTTFVGWSPLDSKNAEQFTFAHETPSCSVAQHSSPSNDNSVDLAFAALISDTPCTPSLLQQPQQYLLNLLLSPTNPRADNVAQEIPAILPPNPPPILQHPNPNRYRQQKKKNDSREHLPIQAEKPRQCEQLQSTQQLQQQQQLDLVVTPPPAAAAVTSVTQKRKWHVAHVAAPYKNKLTCSVSSKTRCEQLSDEIPTLLFSSLKYEIRQRVLGDLCSTVPFLLARATVVDAAHLSEVLKENRSSVLKGVVEASLVKSSAAGHSCGDNALEGTLKVQFTDVSFNHSGKRFCFQVSYFAPQDLCTPVMVVRSAQFRVLARKPSQNKKRKLGSLDYFERHIDELLTCSRKLKQEERRQAMELVSTKLLQMDPHFFLAHLSATVPPESHESRGGALKRAVPVAAVPVASTAVPVASASAVQVFASLEQGKGAEMEEDDYDEETNSYLDC